MLSFLALLSLLSTAALAADPELVAAFRRDPPAADFIFLLDTSGSLLPGASAAREDIARFVETSIPTGDSVEIVAIHTRPTDALPTERVDDAGRAGLAARIRALELTTARDQDLGSGLAFVADRLNRATGGASQFVFAMSNFCHDPSIASKWDSGGGGCRAIRGLDAVGAAFRGGRGQRVLTLALFPVEQPDRPVHGPGLEAVRTMFGPVAEVRQSAVGLGAALDQLGPKLPTERVAALAKAEAAGTALSVVVEKAPTEADPTAVLRLASGLSHLGLRLDRIEVRGAVTSEPSVPLVVGADARIKVTVQIPAAPVSLLPASDIVELPITLTADGVLLPTEDLRAAGVTAERRGLTAAVTLSVARTYGPSAPVAALALAGILLAGGAGAVLARARLKPRQLGGTFAWRKGTDAKRIFDIGSLAEAAIVIRPDGDLAVGGASGSGPRPVLILRIVRPIWTSHAEVEIFAENVEINRKLTRPGKHRIVAGATSFQFGAFRLTWE